MKTTEYLDLVKAKRSLPSDYALAKLLEVTTSSIIAYRNGRAAFGIEVSMKVGEILEIDGHKIYADGQIERAKNSAQLTFWKDISEKFSVSFLNLILGSAPRHA